MTNAHAAYNRKFYASQSVGSVASARRVMPVVVEALKPASLLDVGCGAGGWLAAAKSAGVPDVQGVDGAWALNGPLYIDPQEFAPRDLAQPLDLGRRFDLAMSVEVAEHIAGDKAALFVGNLCRHADTVLFAAALPGQGGKLHVNERPLGFWIALFAAEGYAVLDPLRPYFWSDPEVGACYRQNLVVFARNEIAEGVRAKFEAAIGSPSFGGILDVAHPVLLQERADYASFPPVVRLKLAVKLLLSVVSDRRRYSV